MYPETDGQFLVFERAVGAPAFVVQGPAESSSLSVLEGNYMNEGVLCREKVGLGSRLKDSLIINR
jgi:hypothetical protein